MESHTADENLMAALAHLGVIIPFWGILAPVIVWAMHRDRSGFVRAHAIQAIGWQALLIPPWVLMWAGMSFLLFGTMLYVARGVPPPELYLPFGFMGAYGLLSLVFMVVGLVGAYRAFQGSLYRYPFIGHRLDRFNQ